MSLNTTYTIDKKTRNQMNIVLKERSNGKSREECAKLAKIKPQKIVNWCHEGKNGYGEEKKNFYKNLMAIEERLSNDKKYATEIKEFNKQINIEKRRNFLNNIKKGQTRKEASKNSSLNLKLAVKWDSLGRKEIKPFKKFHVEYKNARYQSERKKKIDEDHMKNQTIKHIKNGKTLQKAAKIVKNGEYEKTILNWYAAGKAGNKNHKEFYIACNNSKQKPVNSDILGPLPREWKKHFENKAMNQTGIAWVNKIGNNYVYQRQYLNENIRISDPDIYELHKKVISKNYVWGIRDINKAKKIIKKDSSKKNNNVHITCIRLGKNTVKYKISGTIDNKDIRKVLNKLSFYEIDKKQSHEVRINNKTEIKLEYIINISLLRKFENTLKGLGWNKINYV